ncbi:hypothetical protein ACFL3D_04410 [Candidatus Omnitrophota bacterium]
MKKRNVFILTIVLTLLCFIVSPVSTFAQPEEEENIETYEAPDVAITAKTGALWWSEVNGMSTGVQVTKTDLTASIPFVELGYRLRWYEWDNAGNMAGIGSTEPFTALHKLTLTLSDERIIHDEQWGYLLKARVATGFEQQWSDSYEYEGTVGFVYEHSPEFTIMAGALGHWDPTDYWVIPTAGIRYRANAEEGLSMMLGLPYAYATYQFENGLGLKAGWEFERDVYRLANDNDLIARGYIETWEQIVSLEGIYEVNDNVKLLAGITYTFERDFNQHAARNGDNISSLDIDEAFGITGGVCITF